MKVYKGTDKDMKCRGKQYEIGVEATEDRAEICQSGIHACEYPLDVFSYYAPGDGSRYFVGDLDDISERRESDKVVGKRLTLSAEIGIPGIAKAAVEYITEHLGKEKEEKGSGDMSAATNTGDMSAATNTGDWSAATNTGGRSAATNTGDWSAATNTGYRSAATNTGDWSAATNTGGRSAATNTGYRSAATNTGDWSAATNTGDWSAATNTGDWSAATNTGGRSAAEVYGKDSIALAFGIESKARGALGCWIVLAEWTVDETKYELKDVKAAKVDGETIKPDVWYKLKDGQFIEWRQEDE